MPTGPPHIHTYQGDLKGETGCLTVKHTTIIILTDLTGCSLNGMIPPVRLAAICVANQFTGLSPLAGTAQTVAGFFV